MTIAVAEPVAPETSQAPAEQPPTPVTEEKVGSAVKPSTETQAEADHRAAEQLLEIQEQTKRVRNREKVVEDLKEQLKDAKESFDNAVNELLEMIEEHNGQGQLPFAEKKKEKAASAPAAAKAQKPAEPRAEGDESWRAVTIEQLGIKKPKLVELLTANELTTLGAICDYTNAGKRLIDIKGIGEGAVQLIDDAMGGYWAHHPGAGPEKEKGPKAEGAAGPSVARYSATEIGLTTELLAEMHNTAILERFAKAEAPECSVVTVADRGNFIIMNRVGDSVPVTYRLLPVVDDPAWEEMAKAYPDQKMPGKFAGRIIKDKKNADAVLYLGPDDRAIEIVTGPPIKDIAELQLAPGTIEAASVVLATAPYPGNGPGNPVSNQIDINGVPHIVTTAMEFGDDVYALRPLKDPVEDSGPVDGDPFANRLVLIQSKTWQVGPIDQSLLVRDPGK